MKNTPQKISNVKKLRVIYNSAIYFNLVFDDTKNFPKVLEATKIDHNSYVKLEYNG